MNSYFKLREVLSALNLVDDLPLDEDLVRLIACAGESPKLARFIRLAQRQPDRFRDLWAEGPDELIEELRSTRIPWSKVYRLVPQLAAAIAALERT